MINLAIAVTGASGSIYAKTMLDTLRDLSYTAEQVSVVLSNNAIDVWNYEIGGSSYADYPFTYYDINDFYSPMASGSSNIDAMIICPCSVGTMGKISSGVADNLITRAADVMLKERRKLILVLREMPYNLIHINNMQTITLSGGVICPASPSFYSKPQDFTMLAKTVTDRALKLAGVDVESYSWGEK